MFFLPKLIRKTNRKNLEIVNSGDKSASFKSIVSIVITFILVTFAWIFFRADNIGIAFDYIGRIFTARFSDMSQLSTRTLAISIVFVIVMTIIEWRGKKDDFPLLNLGKSWKRKFRWFLYFVIIFIIIQFNGQEQEFIYFQF